MERDALAQRLMATFVAELVGHVRTLEQGLLALERTPTIEAREELFGTLLRTAHSLKGAARSVRVELVEELSHKLEEVLTAARDMRIPTDKHFFNLLLPITDALGAAAQQLGNGNGNGTIDPPLEEAAARVTEFLSGQTPRPPRSAANREQAIASARHSERETDVVRVSTNKLDALQRQSGELFQIRYRAEARSIAASRLLEMVGDWKRDWRYVERGYAPLLQSGVPIHDRFNRHWQMLDQVINRSRDALLRLERGMHQFIADLGDDRRLVEQTVGPLDATIRWTRMIPFAEACQGLERMARDLSTVVNKDVKLIIEGGDIELDRMVLEGIKDPLMHLVRNAIDHGIEIASVRQKAGKPIAGKITVAAALRGTRIEVKVSDDGKGLDRSAIVDRLNMDGTTVPDDERSLLHCIFQPGFSTVTTITQVSGRGVGLDVVKTQLLRLRGEVEVRSEPGRGTTFVMNMPLTLTLIRSVMIGAGEEVFAIETSNIERILRIDSGDLRSVGGHNVLLLPDGTVPLVTLSELVGQHDAENDAEKLSVIILKAAGQRAALVVDSLQGEREIVVRALGSRLQKIRHVLGGAIMPNGRIALILNAAELVEWASTHGSSVSLTDIQSATNVSDKKRLLIVDDSATIRMLEKGILEAAGYEVTTAADGQEAWEILLEVGADLVVTDIEMPRMDGLSLTEAIRKSQRFHDLPVILVTARESEADRARGMVAGANAYQRKSAFDHRELIAAINRIL